MDWDFKIPERNPRTGRLNKGNSLAKGNTWDKIYSPETRAKQLNHIRELTRIKGLRTSNKPILCLDNNKVYDSITQAAKELGCDPSHISACCKGKRYRVKGLRFEYYYED